MQRDSGCGGEGIRMTLLDSITRRLVLGLGVASRRLREELALARVETPVTDGCLRELVREADAAAREQSGVAACTYEESLREQLALCASFIQRWTGSDEAIAESQGDSVQQLVELRANTLYHAVGNYRSPWWSSIPASDRLIGPGPMTSARMP